ncbi:hypothetical protein ACTMS0_06850 [Micromonospora sp. H33]|uniref:hypothetical protein n=1 Tax=Micromonospora sp. H33 TaxID=3452215 RepID=UPI003F8BA9AB
MLRFAASLAARRSGIEAADRVPLGRRARRAVPLLLAPPTCVAVVVVALVVMSTVVDPLSWHVPWAFDLQLPILTVLIAGGAVGLAVAADRLARRAPSRGWPVVAGVVAPLAFTVTLAAYATHDAADEIATNAPGLVLWLAGLALVLRGAATLAERGRVRAAWCVGVLGALAVADLAVVLAVLSAVPTGPETVLDGVPQGDTVDPVSAPLWLLVTWTDSALGLPRPTGPEIFRITDVLLPVPQFYLAATPYALAWAIRAARTRPEAAPALAVAGP